MAIATDDVDLMDDVQIVPLSPIQASAEVDVQIATAKRYPRSIKRFKNEALAMATLDEQTALECFYSLPRAGTQIIGPSARLAEIIVSSWGNIRAEARVGDAGDKDITASGMCWDLERNVAIRVEVKRRITGKNGNRFNDDMITTAGNAANSIALRNAVFKVVPKAFWKPIYDAARTVAIGDAKTLESRRKSMVETFSKMGVKAEQLCEVAQKQSIEDMTGDDVLAMSVIFREIQNGEKKIDDVFISNSQKEAKAKLDAKTSKQKDNLLPE